MSTRSPQPFNFCLPERKEHSDGLKSSRYHRRRWQEFTARDLEIPERQIERLHRSVPPGPVSALGSGGCLGCRRELELANGRRVVSRGGGSAVRVDDVPVRATWD